MLHLQISKIFIQSLTQGLQKIARVLTDDARVSSVQNVLNLKDFNVF